MQRNSVGYVIAFATAICLVCSIVVASSAVALKDRQVQNQILDQQVKVLNVAGLLKEGVKPSPTEVSKLFEEYVEARVVELTTGDYAEVADLAGFNQQKLKGDPNHSTRLPPNDAGVLWLPKQAKIFLIKKRGQVSMYVLPIEGKGLWSTLYGYLALERDLQTVKGITFYQHGETPGLGGEVDNPRWKGLWPGRKAFDADGKPVIEVAKGTAGPVATDPHRVDGLSGATITARGVTHLVRFWLGEQGFGPYLKKVRSGEAKS